MHRNNERLSKSAHIDFQRRKLHIKNATAKDNGVYSCRLVHHHHRELEPELQPEPVPSVKNYRLKLKGNNAANAMAMAATAGAGLVTNGKFCLGG